MSDNLGNLINLDVLQRKLARNRELPAPGEPVKVARELRAARYKTEKGWTLRRWRSGWWQWQGAHWTEAEDGAIRKDAYAFTENATYMKPIGGGNMIEAKWSPTTRKISDLLNALDGLTLTAQRTDMPAWLDGEPHDGELIVPCANGLLDVHRRRLLPHTPAFFNQASVPFDYDAQAPAPTRWLEFVNGLWTSADGEVDTDSVAALQEWFGYVLSGRLEQQKIMLMIGPTRSGKGVISRVLRALIGPEHVVGPTLSSLQGNFGLAPLLDKSLAIIADARLHGASAHVAVERLLSISGEDTLTVDRKYRDQWTGKLPSRLMVCSNELPQLGDASAAIAGRMVTLMLRHSHLGAEDHTLEDEELAAEAGTWTLYSELPGVLNWSLDGLERLERQGRFTTPRSSDDALRQLQDLASPVSAFVRECCDVALGLEVRSDVLYAEWVRWAERNGQEKKDSNVFGRDLRAAVPTVSSYRSRRGAGERHPVYVGVDLAPDGCGG